MAVPLMAMRLPLEEREVAPEKAAELTKRLRDALRTRYAWPEWALFEEISFSQSYFGGGTRVADGIAMGMWGGSKHHIHGFEIKATRSDWLKEIRTIGKADDAYSYCHRWWLVAPETVVDPAEIPGTWGWLIPRGNTLRVKRQAPVLSPEPLKPWHSAHLVNAALSKGIRGPSEVEDRLVAEYQRGLADGKAAEDARWRPGDLEALRKSVDRFQAASGVEIDTWNGDPLGEAVKFVLSGGLKKQQTQLEYAASYALDALAALALVVPKLGAKRSYIHRRDVDLRVLRDLVEVADGT